MAITENRIQKIDLCLKTIPFYDGNTGTLNMFVNAVDLAHDVLMTLNPPLDAFENSTMFLSLRSKIIGKALDSIKDLEIRSWTTLRTTLINNFSDRASSITILNGILNIKNVKNPSVFLDMIKGKFNNFQAKLFIENQDVECRKAISDFVEKLIITHFITNVVDPFRNNLATRNPKSINELETLVRNDLQYLRSEQINKQPIIGNTQSAFKPEHRKPVYKNNFGRNKPNYNNNYNNNYSNNNYNGQSRRLPAPEPMSVQSGAVTRPWRQESFNTQEQPSSSNNYEPKDGSKIVENPFLELGQIEIDENY